MKKIFGITGEYEGMDVITYSALKYNMRNLSLTVEDSTKADHKRSNPWEFGVDELQLL